MAHQFDRKVARLALEICRYTYAAGVGDGEDAADMAEALAYITAHSNPLTKESKPGKPIPINGGRTSFACVVPYADRNVVSYMGTKTQFDIHELKESLNRLKQAKGFELLTTMREEVKADIAIVKKFRDSLKDWGKNGKARPVAFQLDAEHLGKPAGATVAPLEGRVHHGFLDELKAVQKQIVATLIEHGSDPRLGKEARPVLVTGHSQGGAEAALATRALAAAGFNVEVTYTFAAPRAGTPEFAASVKTPVHRIEFGDDVVPHLPPTLIRTLLEELIVEHKLLLRMLTLLDDLEKALSEITDFGYVGLGPLC